VSPDELRPGRGQPTPVLSTRRFPGPMLSAGAIPISLPGFLASLFRRDQARVRSSFQRRESNTIGRFQSLPFRHDRDSLLL
jgi:hypothetical protein